MHADTDANVKQALKGGEEVKDSTVGQVKEDKGYKQSSVGGRVCMIGLSIIEFIPPTI